MSKQDRQGVRTPAELEQKYNFGDLKKNTKDQRRDMSEMNQMLSQFAASVNTKIAEMEKNIAEIADDIYPVGSVYLSVNDVAPGKLFGGMWERFAEGRVIAGVDESVEAYQAAELTGDIMQGTETNVQPYITCHIWKRTK